MFVPYKADLSMLIKNGYDDFHRDMLSAGSELHCQSTLIDRLG